MTIISGDVEVMILSVDYGRYIVFVFAKFEPLALELLMFNS